MFELVYGGSGCGKSQWAENQVMFLAQNVCCSKKYYIATMIPFGSDAEERIARHKKLRAGKGFETIECPVDLGSVLLPDGVQGATVLVECLGNLTANEMFRDNEIKDWSFVASKILCDIERFVKNNGVENLVLVSNNIFEDGIEYDDGSKNYMKALALLNKNLAKICDKVVEVVAGIPINLKG